MKLQDAMGALSRLSLSGSLVLLLGFGGACFLDLAEDDRFDTWGLPRDLPTRQHQLKTLQLPPAVDSIDWLADGLEVLLISNTNVSNLRDLPETLTTLDLSFTHVTSLRGLPSGLRELNIESTSVQSPLVHLPADLRRLTLSGNRLTSAVGLPEGLTELRLVDTAIQTVSGLPSGLRRLSLEGPSFERIDAMPPKLQSLALRGTNVKVLRGLPESLQSIILQGNTQLILDELPPFLTRLQIDRKPAKPLKDLFYLERLECPLGAAAENDGLPKWPKPLTVLFLDMGSDDKVPSLPTSLRALALLQSRTAPNLPQELENLSFEGFLGSEIPKIPESVRQLSLAWSNIQSIDRIPPTVQDLDISATAVTSLAKLPSGLVSLRFRQAALSQIAHEFSFLRKLQYLDLSGSRTLTKIGAIPPSLVYLNVSGSPVAELPKLPDSLKALDISNTKIRGELPQLPNELESLTLSQGQIQSLSRLPSKVQKLYFVPSTLPAD